MTGKKNRPSANNDAANKQNHLEGDEANGQDNTQVFRGCPKTRISAGRDDLNAKEKRVIIGDKREE